MSSSPAMPIDLGTLAALAAEYASNMTSIRGRRVQRLLKREFAGAEHVVIGQVGFGGEAVLGFSASGAVVCATDGTGRHASVLKWHHGSVHAIEEQFDLHKDSLPLLNTSTVLLASLRESVGIKLAPGAVPAHARSLLSQALRFLE